MQCEAATHYKVNRSKLSAHIKMFQILWQFPAHISRYQHNDLLIDTGNINMLQFVFINWALLSVNTWEPCFYRDIQGVKQWNKNTQIFQDIHRNKKPKRNEEVIITIKFHSSQCSLSLSLSDIRIHQCSPQASPYESCGPPVDWSWRALVTTMFTVHTIHFVAFMQRKCYNLYPISSRNAVSSICTHSHNSQTNNSSWQ